ncbi:MAG: glutamate carboxypeptidase [Burkholderiales bacterium]
MKHTLRRALLATLVIAATSASAATDEKLLAAARVAEPAVIESLKEMVTIESGTMDLPGLGRMADYAERRLKALGLQVERRPTSTAKGEMLIGRVQGSGRRKLMLIAHLDTIYWPGTLATQPIKLDGNKLYGPGIADDKGGVAVILHSLDILKAAGWQDYAQLTVLFNSDEESQSAGSGETIADVAGSHDVVLSYEPTAAKAMFKTEGVLLAAAGTGTVTMTVSGRASHAGAAPEQGRNALIELAHQISQTADIVKGIPGAQLNWTQASAGRVRNQIPDQALASGDLRLTAVDAAQKLEAALKSQAAQHKVPDTETSIVIDIGRPPFAGDARTLGLAKRAQAIYAELDGRPLMLVPGTGGGTDAGYASRSGKPVVLESLGLAGWGYHARDEYIEIDSIVPRLYLTTRLLMDLGRD